MNNEPEAQALIVARRYARWHLGNPDYADRIIGAYLNPERAREDLAFEMGEDA